MIGSWRLELSDFGETTYTGIWETRDEEMAALKSELARVLGGKL